MSITVVTYSYHHVSVASSIVCCSSCNKSKTALSYSPTVRPVFRSQQFTLTVCFVKLCSLHFCSPVPSFSLAVPPTPVTTAHSFNLLRSRFASARPQLIVLFTHPPPSGTLTVPSTHGTYWLSLNFTTQVFLRVLLQGTRSNTNFRTLAELQLCARGLRRPTHSWRSVKRHFSPYQRIYS